MDFLNFREQVLDYWEENFDVEGLPREFLSAVVRHHQYQISGAGLMESKPSVSVRKTANVLADHLDKFLGKRYRLYLKGAKLTAKEFNERVKAWPNVLEDRAEYFPIGNGLTHEDALGLYKEFSKGKNPFRVEVKLKRGQRKLTGFKRE